MENLVLTVLVVGLFILSLRKLLPGFCCSQGFARQDGGEFESAERWFLRALNFEKMIQRITGRPRGIAVVSMNLGFLYHRQRRMDEAAEKFDTAIRIYSNIGRTDDLGTVYFALGKLCFDKRDLVRAEQALNDALVIYRRRPNVADAVEAITAVLRLIAQQRPTRSVPGDTATSPEEPPPDLPEEVNAEPEPPQSSPESGDRVVRVFVSSTFRDMQSERDELIKHVFPQLRKLCEERGVSFSDVDLRWGVTNEDAAEGKVLPTCLAEIARCRPFFIGLLGERYGWVPDEIPAELIEREHWLAQHRQKSVTELEILHGVLNNPDMANRAIFYFRDPKYLDRLPADQRAEFVETDPVRQEKLTALKQQISQRGLPCFCYYPDPQTLGQWVQEHLTVAINQMFPPHQVPDPLARDAAEHESFARSRASVEVRPGKYSGVYIGRPEYFACLDALAAGDGPPLVVLGDSGSGKSALLANWALRYRRAHPKELVLMHFIGATPYSAEWAAMLRRLLGELKRHFDLEGEIPDKPAALPVTFANWLTLAAARGRVVLILDALNQLEDRDGAPDLVWLPQAMPTNVRLVVSTLPGRPLKELTKRNWPTLLVKPLDTQEREQFIREYLAQFAKSLSPQWIERIAAASPTANPLYLQALLEELRVFGVHETLGKRIEHYLAAETVDGLFGRILERYETDYERDRPGLVRDAMVLLWSARRGLSEAELLDLLGENQSPNDRQRRWSMFWSRKREESQATISRLPRAHWSPLFLAAERSFVNRSGLLGFSHDYLRCAVSNRYLQSEDARSAARLRLADYFDNHGAAMRRIEELPWQLAEALEWSRLASLLAKPTFLPLAWRLAREDIQEYWSKIEKAAPRLGLGRLFREILAGPYRYDTTYVWTLGELLGATGHAKEALAIWRMVAGDQETADHEAVRAGAISNVAESLRRSGNLDEAYRLQLQAAATFRSLTIRSPLARCLVNLALMDSSRGQIELALQRYEEAGALFRAQGDTKGLQTCLANRAEILRDQRDLDGAMQMDRESESLAIQATDNAGRARSLGAQADVHRARGEFDQADMLLAEAAAIFQQLGDQDGLGNVLAAQGLVMCERAARQGPDEERCLDEAMRLHRAEEAIWQKLDDPSGLARCLANQARILCLRGEYDEAMRLCEKAETLSRRSGDQMALQIVRSHSEVIRRRRGH